MARRPHRSHHIEPLEGEVPDFSDVPPRGVPDWHEYWKEMFELHKHEDVLFNGRLHAFALGTSLLLAGVSQFRTPEFLPIALLVCLAGVIFSLAIGYVLHRSAITLHWDLEVLTGLEERLYSDRQRQIYRNRRLTHRETGVASQLPVNTVLAVWFPRSVVALWLFIFALLMWVHRGEWLGLVNRLC